MKKIFLFSLFLSNYFTSIAEKDTTTLRIDTLNVLESNIVTKDTINAISDFDLFQLTDSVLNNDKKYLEDYKIDNFIALKADELPDLSDEIIKLKLGQIPTTLNVRFTPEIGEMVRRHLHRNRSFIVKMLTRSEQYFPLFEQELDKRNMPLELKYLPVIESHLNPQAVSPMGATGLWQFMYATATYKGLNISSLEDQRRDPAISSAFATDYLLQLYTIYDDWLLAMSSYNAGAGNINKAIRACGGVRNYWVARRFMPTETQQYVPKIIAVMYAMYYAEDYYLYPRKPDYSHYDLAEVKVFDELTLKYCSELLGLDEELLLSLNPVLSKKIVPKREFGYVLNIPKDRMYQFEANEGFFYDDPYLVVEAEVLEEKHVEEHNYVGSGNYKNYTIETGDNLGFIAEKFNCSVSDLKKWNGLTSNFLRVGKKLKIYSDNSSNVQTAEAKAETVNENIGFKAHEIDENSCGCHKHEISSGDNLWDISIKYNSSIEKIKELNNIPKTWKLRLGTFLKIPKS